MVLAATAAMASAEAGMLEKAMAERAAKRRTNSPKVKVLIVKNADAAVIEVKGRYNIYDPLTNEMLASRYSGKRNLMQPLAGGLKWGEEFPGIYQIMIEPDSQQVTTVVDGIEYRGTIYIYDIEGTLCVVNHVDIEDYLNSTLAYAIKDKLSPEALAAIAIIERTNTMFQIMNSSNPYWHVKAEDVEYGGNAMTSRGTDMEKALTTTKYIVMSASQGERILNPFPANWSPGSAAVNASKERETSALAVSDANAQAKQGLNAAKILSKVYPEASLVYVKDVSAIKPVPNKAE